MDDEARRGEGGGKGRKEKNAKMKVEKGAEGEGERRKKRKKGKHGARVLYARVFFFLNLPMENRVFDFGETNRG